MRCASCSVAVRLNSTFLQKQKRSIKTPCIDILLFPEFVSADDIVGGYQRAHERKDVRKRCQAMPIKDSPDGGTAPSSTTSGHPSVKILVYSTPVTECPTNNSGSINFITTQYRVYFSTTTRPRRECSDSAVLVVPVNCRGGGRIRKLMKVTRLGLIRQWKRTHRLPPVTASCCCCCCCFC